MAVVSSEATKKLLLGVSCVMLAIGNCGGPLLTRLYFFHGGSRIWLSSFLVTAGWPIMAVPLAVAHMRRRAPEGSSAVAQSRKVLTTEPRLLAASAVIGILTGLDDYLYASGVARLPVSTSALILSAHLAFTAGFAFLLVRQRFTAYSVNAMVVLTMGAVVLGVQGGDDRPAGESGTQYGVGFVMMVGTAAVYGAVLPAVEWAYRRAKQGIGYRVVMETQMVMSLFATAFCGVGMLLNHDLQAIGREARAYRVGAAKYYWVLACNAVVWQLFFIGAMGVVFCSTALLSAVVIAGLLPVTAVLGVIFYGERFHADKGAALALCLWGFASYFYGEFKHSKDTDPPPSLLQTLPPSNV